MLSSGILKLKNIFVSGGFIHYITSLLNCIKMVDGKALIHLII